MTNILTEKKNLCYLRDCNVKYPKKSSQFRFHLIHATRIFTVVKNKLLH